MDTETAKLLPQPGIHLRLVHDRALRRRHEDRIGSDHAGFRYKEAIKRFLAAAGHEVRDFGTDSEETVDYPLFIHPVAAAVAAGEVERGVVLGGSGNGEAMVANRVRGARGALC